jgi:MFS superfamily sulfate permease-like transporter
MHLNAHQLGFTPLQPEHLVQMPVFKNIASLWSGLSVPNWSGLLEPSMYVSAFTLAIVASLESLLSIEAVDKLDPEKRISPTNRELKAQGVGNMISGLLGGLPVTSVIVRSSANVNAGGKSKASAIMHGFWLLLSLLFLTQFINLIPKASLAAILIYTGYKLSSIKIIREYYVKGSDQFVPFSVTIISILFTDLLTGIVIGILVGLFFVVKSNFRSAILVMKDDVRYLIRFKREVSFLNKSFIRKTFEKIPDETAVLIDPTRANFIDKDVIDIVNDFIVNASTRGIRVYIKRNPGDKEIFVDPQKREII